MIMDLTNDVVIHVKKGDVQYLQFRRLLEFPKLQHAYIIKPLDFRMRNSEIVIENCKKMCNVLKLDINKLSKPNQTHTNNIGIVKSVTQMDIEENFKQTDGLITDVIGASLVSVNADCILLMCYDPVKNVIANVHSGWRGTVQKIAVNMIKSMALNYGCNPKDIICCICPSIRKCHFEVEKEVKDIFEQKFNYTKRINDFIEYIGKKQNENGEIADKWVIDTVLINKIMLSECGLLSENIIDSGICSVCNSKVIHSCRADGKDSFGLNSAMIAIK